MNIVAIVQARVGSTRLPKKILLDLAGKTVVERVIERVRLSKLINKIVLATTTREEDEVLSEIARKLGIDFFQGSENDVLDRYYQAAKRSKADVVVRITADCPLIDPSVIDLVIQEYLDLGVDYTSNTIVPTFPDGEDVEVFSFRALAEAWASAALPSEREHVTPFIKNNPGRFKLSNVKCPQDYSDFRWTLDQQEDYNFIRLVFEELFDRNQNFGMQSICEFVAANPELKQMNQHIIRNEGYLKSLNCDRGGHMSKTQKLYEKAKRVIPGGTQLLSKRPEMFLPGIWPAYYSKAKGCRVWDLDGREYIDMSYMGIGACILGYADPDVNEAVKKTITLGSMTTLNAPEEVSLAQLLVELHPWAQMARFARTGGEAMAIAVRIARAKTKKDMVLFSGYHGWHDWYLSANLAKNDMLDGHLLPGLNPLGVPRALRGVSLPFSYNDTETFKSLVKKHRGKIGVVVLEAIRHQQPSKDFVESVRRIASEENIVLVVDEITSGWRLCNGGAHLTLGIQPDIAVFGKGLSNGFPMAAIIGKKEVMEAVQGSFVSSTYWTDRIGPAAALASIEKMKKKMVYRHLISIGSQIKECWRSAAEKYGVEVEISGIDPLGHFNFAHKEKAVLKTLYTQTMLEAGILATTAFYASYAHKQADVGKYANAANKAFKQISQAVDSGSPEKYLKGPVCHGGFKRLT